MSLIDVLSAWCEKCDVLTAEQAAKDLMTLPNTHQRGMALRFLQLVGVQRPINKTGDDPDEDSLVLLCGHQSPQRSAPMACLTGPPCSGKTTYANKLMRRGRVVHQELIGVMCPFDLRDRDMVTLWCMSRWLCNVGKPDLQDSGLINTMVFCAIYKSETDEKTVRLLVRLAERAKTRINTCVGYMVRTELVDVRERIVKRGIPFEMETYTETWLEEWMELYAQFTRATSKHFIETPPQIANSRCFNFDAWKNYMLETNSA